MTEEIQVNLLDYFTRQNKYIDDAGFLRTTGVIGRIGVQKYDLTLDGERKTLRVYRSPEEVQKSASTFRNKPQSIGHPDSGEITTENADAIVGHLGEVIYQDGLLIAEQIFYKKDSFPKIQNTHKYNSSGYKTTLVLEKGIWVDELGIVGPRGQSYEYDAYQKDIKGNHNAAVEFPRAGAIAAIQLDSAGADSVKNTQKQGEVSMTSINCCIVDCGGDPVTLLDRTAPIEEKSMTATTTPNAQPTGTVEKSNAEEIASAVKLQLQDDKIKTLATELESLKKQLGEREQKIQELEQNLTDSSDRTKTETDKPIDVNRVISDRVKLWSRIEPQMKMLDSAFIPDYSLDTAAIMRTYLAKRFAHFNDSLRNKPEDYLAGAFEMLEICDEIAKTNKEREQQQQEENKQQPSILTDALNSIHSATKNNSKGFTQEADGKIVCTGLTAKRKAAANKF
jgi:hypothetical protein